MMRLVLVLTLFYLSPQQPGNVAILHRTITIDNAPYDAILMRPYCRDPDVSRS